MDPIHPTPLNVIAALNQALEFGQLERQWLDFARKVEESTRAPTLGQAESLEGRITQLGRILSRFGDELTLGLPPAKVDLPTNLSNPTQEQIWTYWRQLCSEIIPEPERDPRTLRFQGKSQDELKQAEASLAQLKTEIGELESKISSLTTPGQIAGGIAGEVVQSAGAVMKNAMTALAGTPSYDRNGDLIQPEFDSLSLGDGMGGISRLKEQLGKLQRRLARDEEKFQSRDWRADIRREQEEHARRYSEASTRRDTYEKELASKGLQIWERLSKTCDAWRSAYPKPTLLSFLDLQSNLPIPNWPSVQDTWEGRALKQNLERHELRLDRAKSLATRVFGVCYECRHLMVQGTSGDRLVASCGARVLDPPKRPDDWPYRTWTNIQDLPKDCCLSLEPLPSASSSEPAE